MNVPPTLRSPAFALAIGLSSALAGCATGSSYDVVETPPAADPLPVEAKPSTAMRDLTDNEKAILAETFSIGLSNPESVKFLWPKVSTVSIKSSRSFDYCGKVNFKNDKGAYTRFQPFLAVIATDNGTITGGSIARIEDAAPQNAGQSGVARLCQQKGLMF